MINIYNRFANYAKRGLPVFLLLLSSGLGAQYTWRAKACLPAAARDGDAAFAVGGYGYLVCATTTTSFLNEVWKYDPTSNTWTQMNAFPVSWACPAVFVINDTAYVGLGADAGGTYQTGFWKYNAGLDLWIPVANFPGAGRYLAMAFAVGGKGYAGCGKGGGQYNDFYQYDPVLNTWAQIASLPAPGRQGGAGFTVGGNGYVGFGYDGNVYNDLYKYDVGLNSWTSMNVFPGQPRETFGFFVINDTFYIAAGYVGTGRMDDCWRYNTTSDSWTQQQSFTCVGAPRSTLYGFTLNGRGYMPVGDYGNGTLSRQLLEFGPMDTTFTGRVRVLGNDTSYCGSFTRNLTAPSTCTLWSTGATGLQISVNTPGTYWALFPDTCGIAVDTIVITQGAMPPQLGNDTTYCGNFTSVLSSPDPGTLWSTGASGAQITVTTPGTYWARVSNACGTAADTIRIAQNPAPALNQWADTSLCNGQSLILVAANVNSTYLWQDNSTDSAFTVTTTGEYRVTVSNNYGCKITDSISVTFNALPPVINLGPDTLYCGNFSQTLNSGYAGTLWSTGVTSAQISVNNAGVYWASFSNGCGTASDTIILTQNISPAVTLGKGGTICAGDSMELQVVTTAANILWSNNATSPAINITEPGNYWVEAWNVSSCRTRDSVTVSNGAIPVFSLGPDTSLCSSIPYVLKVPLQNVHYQWQDHSVDSFYNVVSSGTYSVTAANDCGSATSKVNVNIHTDDCGLLIPTAFSPNGDGRNDIFRAVSHCSVSQFVMHIYNRWGEQVYSSANINDGWDGTYKNQAQELSVYVYWIQYFNECDMKLKFIKGNVTLIR